MTIEFGDYDPEDAFDESDPPGEKLRNFALRLAWVSDRLDFDDFLHRTDVKAHVQRLRDDLEHLRSLL